MIREIMRDEVFLAQKAEPATPEDPPVAQDLLDTLAANKDHCVGMAANMIGVNKRINFFWTFEQAVSYYQFALVNYIGFHDRGTVRQCVLRPLRWPYFCVYRLPEP